MIWSLQGTRARLFVAALIIWPLVHLASSRAGQFSSWRFGGWGMYASPYPSARQRPVHVVLSFGGEGGATREPLRVRHQGHDITELLAGLHGLSLYAAGGKRSEITLQSPDAPARLAERLIALRQLNVKAELVKLAGLIEDIVPPARVGTYSMTFVLGERKANLVTAQFGVQYTFYSLSSSGHMVREGQRQLDPKGLLVADRACSPNAP